MWCRIPRAFNWPVAMVASAFVPVVRATLREHLSGARGSADGESAANGYRTGSEHRPTPMSPVPPVWCLVVTACEGQSRNSARDAKGRRVALDSAGGDEPRHRIQRQDPVEPRK